MKKLLAGAFALVLTLAALTMARADVTIDRIIGVAGTPVLTSCGTGSPTIVGTDLAGTVTTGSSATGCVITFARVQAAAPHCVVTWIATPLASQSYATSTTAITLTQTSASANVIKYFCVGQN